MGQQATREEQPISTEDAHHIIDSISRKSADGGNTSRPLAIIARENEGLAQGVEVGKYVAIDCEMVGVGPNPDKESALARVSAVNFNGDQVYDSYVRPKEEVTDWRTHVSGIQPKHMVNARSFEKVQKDIAELLDGRVLVGHAIRNDLQALLLSHPKRDIRDTAKHQPFRRYAGGGTPKLKVLASAILGISIQSGEHSSVEDARACMLIFRREKDCFEKEHSKAWRPPVEQSNTTGEDGEVIRRKPYKKKKRSKRR